MNLSDNNGDLLSIQNLHVVSQDKEVLKNITLSVRKGEIHSVFSDDQESKSILLKVLAGEIFPESGTVFFGGRQITSFSPRKFLHLGIELIDNTPKEFLNLSVFENIFCERMFKKNLFMRDRDSMRKRAAVFFSELSVNIDLDKKVSDIPAAQRRLLPIARSICASPRLLLIDENLLDEIRSTIGAEIIEKLQYIFFLLVNRGMSVLYCSKDPDRILHFSDRISIMSCGEILKTIQASTTDKMQLIQIACSSIFSRGELEKSNFELFYIKQIYDGIINSVGFPLLVTDTKQSIVLFNKAAEKFLKREPTTLLSEPLSRVIGLTDELIERIENEIKNESFTTLDLSDPERKATVFFSPVLDEDDSYLGMLLIFSRKSDGSDISKEIIENNKKYETEQHIRKVVHEIKNPLGIILNYLELIQNENSAVKICEDAKNIENEVKRISRLIERVGEVRKEKLSGNNQGLRLSVFINEIAKLLIPDTRKKGITLNLVYDYDAVVQYNPDLLKQVVLNIMLNGIEAMHDGGELVIRCKKNSIKEKSYIIIEIQDSGIGIPKENMDKIFTPFFTTKNNQNSNGIGLSISQEITENMGGFITAESTLKKGSIFRIHLPF
jgi:signal transduction histidine kinase/ABC-type branched-subunit amino acid transport system ATPase component